MHGIRIILISAICATASASFVSPVFAAGTKTAASGETQIVARLDGREITISDIRSELARLGRSPNDLSAERMALDSVINRNLLAAAARAAKIHRQPEALRRMAVAREQALADLFVATASQPPEPTLTEIEDFVTQNTALFAERRIYTFSVLTMPTEAFDSDRLTPLFDASDDFSSLAQLLTKSNVQFAQAPLVQPANAFPEAIRNQLAQYDVRDNIVIQGDVETQIMKIGAVTPAPIPTNDALAVARKILLQQSAQSRAEALLVSLKKKASLSYFRATAAPLPSGDESRDR